MIQGQILPAFIAKLYERGVNDGLIARAVDDVLDIKLGESITKEDDELLRAFCFEQAQRLEGGRG